MRRPRANPLISGLIALLFLLGVRGFAQEQAVRWAFSVRSPSGYITFSSPALSPDGATIYVGVERATSGRVVAVSSAGALRWVRDLTSPVDSTPALTADGRTLYVGSVGGSVYALNTADGTIRWEFRAGSFVTSSPAIGADGTIYFGTGNGRFFAVGPQGNERWHFDAEDWIDSSPAIGPDGTVYFGSQDQSLYALSPTGELRWRFQTGGPVFSSPAIGRNGTIFFGSYDQRVYALTPQGGLLWSYFTNGLVSSSPAIGADETVYVASADTGFYALDPRAPDAQRVKWRADLRSTSVSTAAVRGDGVIIVGADDGRVRAFNPDGTVRWTVATDDEVWSSPAVAPDGSIYVGSLDGKLYKIAGNGSPLSAFASWPAFRADAQHSGRAKDAAEPGQLVNLSTRARTPGDERLIAGFYVQGAGAKAFLIRGVGPTLSQFGVTDPMPDPRLELYAGQTLRLTNDNWGEAEAGFSASDTATAVNAFPLPAGSKDAAVLPTLGAGQYSVHVTSTDRRSGVVLVEAYDAIAETTQGPTNLVNLSIRSRVSGGENNLFMGFVVDGRAATRLLVRAVGPGLSQFGVADVLARPAMTLYRGSEPLRSNTGWTSEGLSADLASAANAVGAFPLSAGSNDSAMILSLAPGAYTVQISGVNGGVGEALAEVYVLP